MKFIGIIPARYASTRFPGKPLALLGGKPVIQHVYEKVAAVLETAYVATDDERIYAFRRTLGKQHIYVLVNFTLEEVRFSADFLQEEEYLLGNYVPGKKGHLRPLEAVVYQSKARR